MKRHCLKIPFLIGQRDDSIIGNSCRDNPVWEVPCYPGDISDVVCQPGAAGEPPPLDQTLPSDAETTLTLSAPVEKTLVLS